MAVQITPYQGFTPLKGIAFGDKMRQGQQRLAQAERQMDIQDTRNRLTQQQIAQAAANAKMTDQQFMVQLTQEIIAGTPNAEEAIKYMSALSPPDRPMAEEAKTFIRGLSPELFGTSYKEKFSSAPKSVIGADGKPALVQFGDQGGARAIEGFAPMPKSGEQITVGPDGEVRITRGPVPTNSRSTQKVIDEQLLTVGDTLQATRSMLRDYDAKYHQVGTRLRNAFTTLKDKAGIDISAYDKAELEDFTRYKAGVSQQQAQIIKSLSGAAVTATEEKRLNSFLVNAGTGIFDGDSPVQAEQKLQSFLEQNELIQARYAYLSAQGLSADEETLEKYPIDQMQPIMQQRFDILLDAFTRMYPQMPAEEVRKKARDELGREFGLL